MKEYYRIGETASLMGITTQTLRFYDKIGLVKPIKIDPRTGYRYYAYEQFHFIDRIKYLQSLGMPLDDIKEVMLSKKVERLLPFLDQQKKVLEEEEKKIRHQIEMQVPCYKRDLLADMEIRLAKEKSEQGIDNAMYLRQYGYKISYDAFCKQKFRPDYYFIYLNEKVKDAPNILKLPEGDYLCFRERILEEAWNPQRIISYFQGKAKPELIKQVHKNYFKAGADIIAPSDMMDKRVEAIRNALDEAGLVNIPICSYSAKFASGYYGPFRDAAHSAPGFGDRKTYQMDPANGKEALREVEEDILEGADMIIAKPALGYMDVMKEIALNFNIPIVAYNVSGEYAMVKAAAMNGWIDEKKIVMENMTGFKRAGAKMIITYHAIDVAKWLKEE